MVNHRGGRTGDEWPTSGPALQAAPLMKKPASGTWTVLEHTRGPKDKNAGQKYFTWVSPTGDKFRSLKKAKENGFVEG